METEVLYDRRVTCESALERLEDEYFRAASEDNVAGLTRMRRLRHNIDRYIGEIQDIDAMILAHY